MTSPTRNVNSDAAKPTALVTVVTPKMASDWLGYNHHNRPARESLVNSYARDMATGRWRITGEAVKFAFDGTLLDGQHRLKAVVKANTNVPMFVVRGLRRDAQEAMDTGAKRSAADALSLNGEQHSTLLAAAARLAIGIERGNSAGRVQVTHAEVIDFIARNPDLREAVAFARSVARRTDCIPAVVAYTTWRLSQIDQAAAQKFWIDAAEKVGLAIGDPILALTNRLAEARRTRERLSPEALLSAIYRAWNARRMRQPLRLIKIKSSAGGLVGIPEPQ